VVYGREKGRDSYSTVGHLYGDFIWEEGCSSLDVFLDDFSGWGAFEDCYLRWKRHSRGSLKCNFLIFEYEM
jgi:hypothetical protein